MNGRGIFFLIAGPAGVGKTTLLNRLFEAERGGPPLIKAVSVTTRQPRAGEVDGKSYFFWDDVRFDAAVAANEFLEHAVVHGFKYGTPARFIDEQLAAGVDVIKDIDVQGFEQIRRIERFRYPRTVGIFVMPPTREDLIERLKGRGSEGQKSLETRIRNANEEMDRRDEYDYCVINDCLDRGVTELKAIRLAEHCRINNGRV
jgi:guanylate kinase